MPETIQPITLCQNPSSDIRHRYPLLPVRAIRCSYIVPPMPLLLRGTTAVNRTKYCFKVKKRNIQVFVFTVGPTMAFKLVTRNTLGQLGPQRKARNQVISILLLGLVWAGFRSGQTHRRNVWNQLHTADWEPFFFFKSSLVLSSPRRRRFYPLRSSGQAVVTGRCHPFSPLVRAYIFFVAHRVQRFHCSSISIEYS